LEDRDEMMVKRCMKPVESERIYRANALFSEVNKEFNEYCAQRFRSAGYSVFLPQETSVAFGTAEIQAAAVLVAYID
jgi:hypothetical protein